MKNIFYCFSFLFISITINAQNWDWAKNINNGAKDIGTSIGTDQQGNIYVTGSTSYTTGGGGSYYYAMFWKFDKSGNKLWADTIEFSTTAVTDKNGFTYITGGNRIDKYNSSGQKIWLATVPIAAYFQNIALNPSGGIVVVGRANISNTSKGILVRYDENGNCLWTKINEFPQGGVTVTCDNEGNSYAAGDGYKDSTTGNTGFLVKYNNSGNLIYIRSIPHTPNDIAIDNQNNIYVTGWYCITYPIYINGNTYYANNTTNIQPQYLIKYDQIGNILWYKIITGQIGRDMITTDKKGNVYLTIGYSTLKVDSVNLNSSGILVMKADSIGNILWYETSTLISPSGSLYPNDILVNSTGEVLITGAISGTHSFGSSTLTANSMYSDLLIAKINQPSVNAVPNSNINPLQFHVYPNPTTGVFQITYSSVIKNNIQLNIIDSKGQIVFTEKNSQFQGDYNKSVDLSKQSKGAYFIEIIADPTSQGYEGQSRKKSVRKIVLN